MADDGAALEDALRQASDPALSLSGEQKAQLFTTLRRHAARAPKAQLGAWQAKAELLQFLAQFFKEKRFYHRQVISFLELLLEQPGWAAAAEPLRKDWPEEMAKVTAGTDAGEGGAQDGVDKVTAAAGPSGGYTSADVEAPVAPQRSMADTFTMLEDALKKLSDANYRYAVSTGSGLEEDDHFMAFELFRRAVCRVTQDQRIETNVLDKINPKDSIVQFLLEVMERKPRHKKRIEALLVLLMQLESWSKAVEDDDALRDATARYRKGLEVEDPPKEENAEPDKPEEPDELDELLADAKRRGAFGVLLIRVIAAYNLINADWFSLSDPYTKVTVDQVCKMTEVVDDCLDPRWDEKRWNFDVQAESSLLRLEVWDKDAVQDDSLGSISMPVVMVPDEMKRLRFRLDRVAHGELEVEMQFIRLPEDAEAKTAPGLELISGGRKLPGGRS